MTSDLVYSGHLSLSLLDLVRFHGRRRLAGTSSSLKQAKTLIFPTASCIKLRNLFVADDYKFLMRAREDIFNYSTRLCTHMCETNHHFRYQHKHALNSYEINSCLSSYLIRSLLIFIGHPFPLSTDATTRRGLVRCYILSRKDRG